MFLFNSVPVYDAISSRRRNVARGNMRIWEDDSYLLNPRTPTSPVSVPTTPMAVAQRTVKLHVQSPGAGPLGQRQRMHSTVSLIVDDAEKNVHDLEYGGLLNSPNSSISTVYPPSPTTSAFKYRREYASGASTLVPPLSPLGGSEVDYKGGGISSKTFSLLPPPSPKGKK